MSNNDVGADNWKSGELEGFRNRVRLSKCGKLRLLTRCSSTKVLNIPLARIANYSIFTPPEIKQTNPFLLISHLDLLFYLFIVNFM